MVEQITSTLSTAVPSTAPGVVTSPNPVLPPPPASTFNKKSVLIIIFGVLFLLSVAVNIYQFLSSSSKPINSKYSLPISPDNENITSFGTVYYFETIINEVKMDSGKIELVTNIKDNIIPKFILSEYTNIYSKKTGGNGFEVKTAEDLKSGQKVGIRVNFDYNTAPEISRVTILP